VKGLGRKLHAPLWIACTASSNDANAVTITTFIHGASAAGSEVIPAGLIADPLVENDHVERVATARLQRARPTSDGDDNSPFRLKASR